MRLSGERLKTKPIKECHCEGAGEFLKQLALGGSLFGGSESVESPWAFRGNGDSFPLVPSALRPETQFITNRSNGHWTKISPSYATYAHRAECELRTLRVFFQQADRHGLPLPEDSQRLRERLNTLIDELKRKREHWPAPDVLSLMAIAQHHGVPTRLLDWSRDPLTAGYFAAEDASRRVSTELRKFTPHFHLRMLANSNCWPEPLTNRQLEVWGINLVESAGSQIGEGDEARCPHVRLVTAPLAGNENLRAQRGLFTIPIEREKAPWDSQTPYEVVPLEQMVLNWRPLHGRAPFLIRVTLPLCLGPELLHLLVRHGITAAKLFPGYDGVVKSMRERELFHAYFADFPFI